MSNNLNEKLLFYRLNKQHLINRTAENWEQVVWENLGLHGTDSLTPYLSLFARLAEFEPEHLFNSLNEHQIIFRIRAFRGTIFWVHRRWVCHVLNINPIIQKQSLNYIEKIFARAGVSLNDSLNQIISSFNFKEILTTKDLKLRQPKIFKDDLWQYLFRYLEWSGNLIRVGMRHLTDPIVRYGACHHWLHECKDFDFPPEKSLQKIFLQYLHQFGPVYQEDISWWFPLNKSLTQKLIEQADQNREIKTIDSEHGPYFMTITDWETFENFHYQKGKSESVLFLPYEDHFPKAYKWRDWYISPELNGKLFNVGKIDYGQLRPSIWVDGKVVGRWEMEPKNQAKNQFRVKIVFIAEEIKRSKPTMYAIQSAKESLENFINEKLMPLKKPSKR